MAVAVYDGVLINDSRTWEDYFVLAEDEDVVYKVNYTTEGFGVEVSSEPEYNPKIVSNNVQDSYFLAVENEELAPVRIATAENIKWLRSIEYKTSELLQKLRIKDVI